jgi:DNA-binding XRE family transcriptional regulator
MTLKHIDPTQTITCDYKLNNETLACVVERMTASSSIETALPICDMVKIEKLFESSLLERYGHDRYHRLWHTALLQSVAVFLSKETDDIFLNELKDKCSQPAPKSMWLSTVLATPDSQQVESECSEKQIALVVDDFDDDVLSAQLKLLKHAIQNDL